MIESTLMHWTLLFTSFCIIQNQVKLCCYWDQRYQRWFYDWINIDALDPIIHVILYHPKSGISWSIWWTRQEVKNLIDREEIRRYNGGKDSTSNGHRSATLTQTKVRQTPHCLGNSYPNLTLFGKHGTTTQQFSAINKRDAFPHNTDAGARRAKDRKTGKTITKYHPNIF